MCCFKHSCSALFFVFSNKCIPPPHPTPTLLLVGHLLDENIGSKFDNIGMNAMANKDNASDNLNFY